jgi:hypothetical protein
VAAASHGPIDKGTDVPRRGWRAEPVAFFPLDLQAKEEEH